VPDATALLHFGKTPSPRRLLEKHKLGEAIFAKVGELLLSNGLKLCGGTIVDATIIAAPSSTKNKGKARDPEMHQTKKGKQWHIGVDSASGLVHSASVTAANVHDSQQLPKLLHGQETRLYGDSAYAGQKQALKEAASKAKDLRVQTRLPQQTFKRARQRGQHDQEPDSGQSRARVFATQAPVGICQSALSGPC